MTTFIRQGTFLHLFQSRDVTLPFLLPIFIVIILFKCRSHLVITFIHLNYKQSIKKINKIKSSSIFLGMMIRYQKVNNINISAFGIGFI